MGISNCSGIPHLTPTLCAPKGGSGALERAVKHMDDLQKGCST
jgi:hypothetical protein